MAKLPKEYQFLDLSDYGRTGGNWIANQLKHTQFTPIHVTTLFIFAGFIAQTLYFSLLESSHLQASLGKFALGIKVVDQQGARLDFLYCLVRNMSKFLSSLIFMLGYLMAAVTKNKQALHDLIAGSYVVRSMPDRDID